MDIVIAKYKEDIQWLEDLVLDYDAHTVHVYNKSEDPHLHYKSSSGYVYTYSLPNIGREAHTFLTYIVTNYFQLPENVLFLQGNPFDHNIDKTRLQELITNHKVNTHCTHVSNVIYKSDGKGLPHHRGLNIDDLYKQLFETDQTLESYSFTPGAQYVVSKECILSKPIEFWKRALVLSIQPHSLFPWEVERLWMYMFGSEQS